jgi:hypothetical protein
MEIFYTVIEFKLTVMKAGCWKKRSGGVQKWIYEEELQGPPDYYK